MLAVFSDRTVPSWDVNRVAEKYLVRNNRTVGVFYPTQKPERADVPDAPEVAKLLAEGTGVESLPRLIGAVEGGDHGELA